MKQTMKNLLGVATIAAVGLAGLRSAEAQCNNTPGTDPTGRPRVLVNGAGISSNTTWTSGNVYILTNAVFVTGGAELTIQPGTVIRGVPFNHFGGSSVPGSLYVTRGSKIKAVGTKTNPIVMTDLCDDNVPGNTPVAAGGYDVWEDRTAQWGGLLILGKAYRAQNSATGPNPAREGDMEGAPASANTKWGGGDDDDNSGIISYVSIRYGGYSYVVNSELNGLSMGGVGRGTKVDHVEILNNLDDGVEIWGGTVNTKYMVVANQGDDAFDTDEGWRGKSQFLLLIGGVAGQGGGGYVMGSGISNRAFESDGAASPDNSQPFAASTIYNVTAIGNGTNKGSYTPTIAAGNVGHAVRESGGQQMYNSTFIDFSGPSVFISNDESGGAAPRSVDRYQLNAVDMASIHLTGGGTNLPASYFYKSQASGYQVDFQDNVVYLVGREIVGTPAAAVTSAEAGLARGAITGDQYDAVAGGNTQPNPFNENKRAGFIGATWNNTVASALPIVSLTRVSIDANIPDVVSALDPRPAVGSDLLTVTRTAPNDGFFSPVGFKGAFPSTSGGLWTAGWTAMTAFGILPNVSSTSASADLTLLSSVTWTSANGTWYVIEASGDMINWTEIGFVQGNGLEKTFIDERGLSTRQFYRVVPQ